MSQNLTFCCRFLAVAFLPSFLLWPSLFSVYAFLSLASCRFFSLLVSKSQNIAWSASLVILSITIHWVAPVFQSSDCNQWFCFLVVASLFFRTEAPEQRLFCTFNVFPTLSFLGSNCSTLQNYSKRISVWCPQFSAPWSLRCVTALHVSDI